MKLGCKTLTLFFALYTSYFTVSLTGTDAVTSDMTVVVNKGSTASIPCFDVVYVEQYVNIYFTIYFTSLSSGQEITIASYEPSSSSTQIKNAPESMKDRIKFLSMGKFILERAELSDEGIFKCTGSHYKLVQTVEKISYLTVYVPPTIAIEKLLDPIPADSGISEIARCVAAGGKPQSSMKWVSVRNFKIRQNLIVTNESSGLSTVSSLVSLEPTRFSNKDILQCKVDHPAFNKTQLREVKLNVIFPPSSVHISVDSQNINLTCSADANPPVSRYSWILPDGATATGQTIPLISPDDPEHQDDLYICTVENPVGQGTTNITTYEATQLIVLTSSTNVGLIIGIVLGSLALVAVVVALIYFLYFNAFRKEDKGPYEMRSNLLLSGSSHSKPAIQHANDSLNKQRPPSPSHPPPSDDKLDHDHSGSSDSDEGNHDVDFEARVVQPPAYDDYPPPPPVPTEITSRSSMNFRANRQRPSASVSSRRSRTDAQMQKKSEEFIPLSDAHYDMPPSDKDSDDQNIDYRYESGDHNDQRYADDSYPYQPNYSRYPDSQHPTRMPRMHDPSQYEPKYSEIDHSDYKGPNTRRIAYEEPVEYAQIRHGSSHLV